MTIINSTKNAVIARQVKTADTFLSRMVGLIGRRQLGFDEALIINRCRSIHMFFMRFSIDAIFVDKNNRVVGLCPNIRPLQLSPIFWKADFVIESPLGTILSTRTEVGDTLVFS